MASSMLSVARPLPPSNEGFEPDGLPDAHFCSACTHPLPPNTSEHKIIALVIYMRWFYWNSYFIGFFIQEGKIYHAHLHEFQKKFPLQEKSPVYVTLGLQMR